MVRSSVKTLVALTMVLCMNNLVQAQIGIGVGRGNIGVGVGGRNGSVGVGVGNGSVGVGVVGNGGSVGVGVGNGSVGVGVVGRNGGSVGVGVGNGGVGVGVVGRNGGSVGVGVSGRQSGYPGPYNSGSDAGSSNRVYKTGSYSGSTANRTFSSGTRGFENRSGAFRNSTLQVNSGSSARNYPAAGTTHVPSHSFGPSTVPTSAMSGNYSAHRGNPFGHR